MIASSIFYNTKTEIFVAITVFLIYHIYTRLYPTRLAFYSEDLRKQSIIDRDIKRK